jgi:hypothetical protein
MNEEVVLHGPDTCRALMMMMTGSDDDDAVIIA